MKIRCKYCESWINDTDEVCKNCGGVNEELKRVANGVPTTIDELKLFCRAHNLPLAKMRFYIGENYKLPKAFGIYKDEASGEFVVYKNKADGSRAIRYQGKDEAYAVNEIYLKLKDEIQNQKRHQEAARRENARQSSSRQYTGYAPTGHRGNTRHRNTGKSRSNRLFSGLLRVVLLSVFAPILLEIIIFASVWFLDEFRPDTGYYHYQDDYYYYYDNDWYIYDDSSSNWFETTVDDALKDNYDSYFSSYSYDSSYDAYDFEDSSYYEEPDYSNDDDWSSSSWDDDDWDSDWDSDYDWDSGSDWDSSYSDWDSDW